MVLHARLLFLGGIDDPRRDGTARMTGDGMVNVLKITTRYLSLEEI
jgi:hypothetical protein